MKTLRVRVKRSHRWEMNFLPLVYLFTHSSIIQARATSKALSKVLKHIVSYKFVAS